jgi:uncharacterized protein YkwD
MYIKKELIAILISLLSYVGMSSYIQIGLYTYILTFLIYFFVANISIMSRDPEVSDDLGNRSVINRILRSLIHPSDTISTIISKLLSVTYNLFKSFILNIFRYPVINIFMIVGLVVIIVVISVVGTPLDKNLVYENDTKISIEETENLIFEDSNNKRTENTNYNRLTRNNSLDKDAKGHAQDMARKNYVAHKSLSGVTVQERYDYCKGGENIHQTWVYSNVNNPSGFGVTNITSEEEISQNTISGWMNSKPHRENLMNKNWNSMGIGVAISKNNKVYVVQAFCS